MIVLVHANVMTIGLNSKSKVLRELPIRIIEKSCGIQAARSLRNEKIDSIISSWDLEDMTDGGFLKRLKLIKPHMPTIAFIKSGDPLQEIQARSLGVSAVLTENTSDELFRRTVENVLEIKDVVSSEAMSYAKNIKKR